jgi:acyl dehydratase
MFDEAGEVRMGHNSDDGQLDSQPAVPDPPLHFEDFSPGDVFQTAARTVTAEDIAAFAELTGDKNPLHTDPSFAASTSYGRIIGHGLLGLSILVGLFEDVGIFRGTALAFLGIEDWQFEAPIFVGDTIRGRMTVGDVRRSRSDPRRGIVSRQYELFNQDGEVVQRGTTTVMVRARTDGD